MKLSPRAAPGYFAKPDPNARGILIYGADAMRVALKRQELIATLVGPQGEEEMRLTRMPGSDLRKDPAQVLDALKAVGFFPGPRVVFVEDANDNAAPALTAALQDWAPGDAQLVVTAGQLNARAKLRKLFEDHPEAYAAAIYDNPPTREEIEATLRKAGVSGFDRDAAAALEALSKDLPPGDFNQTVEKLALYKMGDATPVTPEDITACAPASTEAAVDDALNIVAEGRSGEIGPVLGRLADQGVAPVTLCIMATRHFRTLHAAASDPGGPSAGIGRARPPVYGPRRDRMERQVKAWGRVRLEQALGLLTETDLTLRSAAQTAPPKAVMERTIIRLAMRGRR